MDIFIIQRYFGVFFRMRFQIIYIRIGSKFWICLIKFRQSLFVGYLTTLSHKNILSLSHISLFSVGILLIKFLQLLRVGYLLTFLPLFIELDKCIAFCRVGIYRCHLSIRVFV